MNCEPAQGSAVQPSDIDATAPKTPLLAVVGATATGKTELALATAARFDAEVVNADARLVYRGMDIGTAKPSADDRARIPHHLIDVVAPTGSYNLARYLRDARAAISDIVGRGRNPMLVGGSGQYVWALLEGWNVPEIPVDMALRAELEQMLETQGLPTLQQRLLSLDPDAAAKVDMPNPRRVLRGIERAIATGDASGGATKAASAPYDALVIGIRATRSELSTRIVSRIDDMFGRGWVYEVRWLVGLGVGENSAAMYSIGYREVLRHIRGELSLDAAKSQIARATMRLVDSQENWFKATDERIMWFDSGRSDWQADALTAIDAWRWGEPNRTVISE